MKISILFFAGLKDYFDTQLNLEFDTTCSIQQLIERLILINPGSQSLMQRCRFAVNDNFVSPQYILNHEERICIIPPSSGG
jgi:molybdopterin converting factor small subunit